MRESLSLCIEKKKKVSLCDTCSKEKWKNGRKARGTLPVFLRSNGVMRCKIPFAIFKCSRDFFAR